MLCNGVLCGGDSKLNSENAQQQCEHILIQIVMSKGLQIACERLLTGAKSLTMIYIYIYNILLPAHAGGIFAGTLQGLQGT